MAYEIVLSVTGYSQVVDQFLTPDPALECSRSHERDGVWQVTIIELATKTAYTPKGFAAIDGFG